MFELKKIGIVKRASAFLLDAILLAVLATGFMFIISLICNYNAEVQKASNYSKNWDDFRIEHVAKIANNYGFIYESDEDSEKYTITKFDEDGNAQSASLDEVIFALIKDVAECYDFTIKLSEDGTRFTVLKGDATSSLNEVLSVLNADENRNDDVEKAFKAYMELTPTGLVAAQNEYVFTLLFTMISVGILLAYLVLEFIIPIILKNGQTIGKKVFDICLVRPNCVKITSISLFARTLIGKYAIETMFPILLVFLFLFGGIGMLAIILFAAITLLNVILFIATKNKTPIHDVIAGTVAVDKSLQMIFESEEEFAEKKANYKGFI